VSTIGLVGLGLLGSALAERFLQHGRPVAGFDLRDERRRALEEKGGVALLSALDVFQSADTIVLSLPDSGVVAQAIADNLHAASGKLVIDTTTGDPRDSANVGRQLASVGAEFVDATVLGSSDQARAGQVLVMAGGTPEAWARAQSVLECFAEQSFHLGPCGSGATAKLVVNLVLGLNRAVLAEGLSLARRCQLDVAQVLEILRRGAAYSRVMDTKGDKMLQRDFQPQARLSQHLKDVDLILELGERALAALPLSQVHQQLLRKAESRGYGQQDNSAVICAYDDGTN
jgi:3-hydroxyisobutyrate dehydrogenase-like beta-hydroxyacid dehydrogenase